MRNNPEGYFLFISIDGAVEISTDTLQSVIRSLYETNIPTVVSLILFLLVFHFCFVSFLTLGNTLVLFLHCSLSLIPEATVGSAVVPPTTTTATSNASAPTLTSVGTTTGVDGEAKSVDDGGPWRRAKVVCDYDATSKDEMSLMMNEVRFLFFYPG